MANFGDCPDTGALVRMMTASNGWKIETKFKAKAAFFVVNKRGSAFLGTSGVGGTVLIQVHSKEGLPTVVVCKWQNYLKADGLNARIIRMLPIHRGKDGEFYFKSISSTSYGPVRKTVFALKIHDLNEAELFYTTWLHFNGQIKSWQNEASKSNHDDMAIEIIPKLPESSIVKSLVSIDTSTMVTDEVSKNNRKKKRKYHLVSPRSVHGVGKKKFRFEEEDFKPPPREEQITEPPLPPTDDRSLREAHHDRRIFISEISLQLLLKLKDEKVAHNFLLSHNEDDEFRETYKVNSDDDDDDGDDHRFQVWIRGVPHELCGILWCLIDWTARNSKVPAVKQEQAYIDDSLVSLGFNKYYIEEKITEHCRSIPVVKFLTQPTAEKQWTDRNSFIYAPSSMDEDMVPYQGGARKQDLEKDELDNESEDEDEKIRRLEREYEESYAELKKLEKQLEDEKRQLLEDEKRQQNRPDKVIKLEEQIYEVRQQLRPDHGIVLLDDMDNNDDSGDDVDDDAVVLVDDSNVMSQKLEF